MTDNEKRAHDLAILCLYQDLKEGKLAAVYLEDCERIANVYKHLFDQFIEQFQ